MPKRMLIDSSHPEETRVVVLDGQKVEEFDFEAATRRPLKGNIYLAKVTRVEPSLQAAFVEYGGNRQGFLAFSEIHPDYYQIPVADRIALIAEREAEARRRSEDDVESFEIAPGPKAETSEDAAEPGEDSEEGAEPEAEDAAPERDMAADTGEDAVYENNAARSDDAAEEGEEEDEEESQLDAVGSETGVDFQAEENGEGHEETSSGEIVPNGDASPDMQLAGDASGEAAQALQSQRPSQRWTRRKHYKIQEVIKRRQIILVQVVKEERGNKGAALTTYLSLAGRYCVLMPNTPRGGGISRKITNANDRKRLKSAAQALELPEGMGLIIRTAGENRTKVEIKRDYEYLLRMWDTIRELTLKSNAPACVYAEGDLVKRAIRDLYNKDVSEVLVEGEDGYRNAKDFMRMLMPSHAKNVKLYKEPVPLFHRHHVEAQLDAMFSPTVTLKSGGYIVINQTEALVSIDVNSGRSTREHNIEDTARKTNLEAADEIGRQLRLRDLAGLIVIDFIDMEDGRNDRDVEKRIRDAVKNDRARVQIGKISQFGLLEMSRQRLRAGVIAGSTVPCPHCGGQGIVRSVESTSLRVLRGLEEEGQKLKASAVLVRVASDVAIYTLNQKRRELARIESDYGMTISFDPAEGLMAGTFEIERTAQKTPEEREKFTAVIDTPFVSAAVEEEEPEDVVVEEEELETAEEAPPVREQQPRGDGQPGQRDGDGGGRKRRRRRRGGRDRGDRPPQPHTQNQHPMQPEAAPSPDRVDDGQDGDEDGTVDTAAPNGSLEPRPDGLPGDALTGEGGRRRKRRRRRGRRGGGRDRENLTPGEQRPENGAAFAPQPVDRFGSVHDEIDTTPRMEPRHGEISAPLVTPNAASAPVWSLGAERTQAPPTVKKEIDIPNPARAAEPPSDPAQPVKKGWWQRTFKP
jgi:ribonuclease E